jgi:hypothetical protein
MVMQRAFIETQTVLSPGLEPKKPNNKIQLQVQGRIISWACVGYIKLIELVSFQFFYFSGTIHAASQLRLEGNAWLHVLQLTLSGYEKYEMMSLKLRNRTLSSLCVLTNFPSIVAHLEFFFTPFALLKNLQIGVVNIQPATKTS